MTTCYEQDRSDNGRRVRFSLDQGDRDIAAVHPLCAASAPRVAEINTVREARAKVNRRDQLHLVLRRNNKGAGQGSSVSVRYCPLPEFPDQAIRHIS